MFRVYSGGRGWRGRSDRRETRRLVTQMTRAVISVETRSVESHTNPAFDWRFAFLSTSRWHTTTSHPKFISQLAAFLFGHYISKHDHNYDISIGVPKVLRAV